MASAEEFVLRLTEQISGPAAVASGALAQLEARIVSEQASLGGLEAKLVEASAKMAALGQGADGSVSIASMRAQQAVVSSLQSEIEATRGSIDALEGARGFAVQADQAAAAESATAQMAKATAEQSKAAKGAAATTGEMAGALGQLPGPAGAAGQKIGQMSQAFQKLATLGPAGIIAAIVVVVAALGVALVAGVVSLGQWAVGLADAARSQRLLADGVAGSVAGGAELTATISRLGSVVPQTGDELLKMAGDLAKTGLKGKELSAALEEAAIKAAKLKWGPDFAKQMLSLPNQAAKLKTNMAGVFGGLKIEDLLGKLSTLVSLFDTNTASGKALKFLFEAMFQPLVDGITAAIPHVERGFLTLVLWAMKAYLAVKPYKSEILAVAAVIGFLAAFVGGAAVVAFAVFAGVILVVAGTFAAMQAAANAVISWLGSVDLMQIGTDMIAGLANGITAGGAAVLSAITGVVGGAIAAAKAQLMQKSPSRVFADIGLNTSLGYAEGVDDGAPAADSAVKSMVAPPDAAAMPKVGGKAGLPAPAASSGGAPLVAFNDCTFGGDVTEGVVMGWVMRGLERAGLDASPEPVPS